jgi:hypothetical protein
VHSTVNEIEEEYDRGELSKSIAIAEAVLEK